MRYSPFQRPTWPGPSIWGPEPASAAWQARVIPGFSTSEQVCHSRSPNMKSGVFLPTAWWATARHSSGLRRPYTRPGIFWASALRLLPAPTWRGWIVRYVKGTTCWYQVWTSGSGHAMRTSYLAPWNCSWVTSPRPGWHRASSHWALDNSCAPTSFRAL